jgi:hypothetical protein
MQCELQLALAETPERIFVRGFPRPAVPQHDSATAILTLRDGTFKVTVVDRVIFDFDSKALVGRVDGGTFRNPMISLPAAGFATGPVFCAGDLTSTPGNAHSISFIRKRSLYAPFLGRSGLCRGNGPLWQEGDRLRAVELKLTKAVRRLNCQEPSAIVWI